MEVCCRFKAFYGSAVALALLVVGFSSSDARATELALSVHTRVVAPHKLDNLALPLTSNAYKKYAFNADNDVGAAASYPEVESASFVQRGRSREMYVGILDQDFLMQASNTLKYAFKSSSKYEHSVIFLKQLFRTSPFLKYSALRFSNRRQLVDAIMAAATKWRQSREDKISRVEDVLAEFLLKRLYSRVQRLQRRGQYKARKEALKAALHNVNAGSQAIDLLFANKIAPVFSWTNSLWKSPTATLINVVSTAFNEAVGGVQGIFQSQVRSSCFSFGHRVNTIAPYTAVFPGGVFGSVLKSLIRGFMVVFFPILASFKGIFALMIGVICKSGILQAANKLISSFINMSRLGLRGVASLMRKFAVRGDPVATPIIDDVLRNSSPALITSLFQLHSLDIEDITRQGKKVTTALSSDTASWNFANGLWVGSVDFGRGFFNIVKKYISGADAFVAYCEQNAAAVSLAEVFDERTSFADIDAAANDQIDAAQQQAQDILNRLPFAGASTDLEDEMDASSARPSATASAASSAGRRPDVIEEELYGPIDVVSANAFDAIAPGVQASPAKIRASLARACKSNGRFVRSYRRQPQQHITKLVEQLVKALKYDYKFFRGYVGDMLSIFYEMAYALLESDVANVINENLSLDAMNEKIHEAVDIYVKQKKARAAIEETALPRKMFRAPWFTKAGEQLAHGFFDSAAGMALYYAIDAAGNPQSEETRNTAAFKHLAAGGKNMRRSLSSIYGNFLSSSIHVARLFGQQRMKTVEKFLAVCSEGNAAACGNVKTTRVDPEAFVMEALISLHLPMAVPRGDIIIQSQGRSGEVFQAWNQAPGTSPLNVILSERIMARNTIADFVQFLRESLRQRLSFSRFEFSDEFTTLVLVDTNGRSLIFRPDNIDDINAIAGIGRRATGNIFSPPSPLTTRSWFVVDQMNHGTLHFLNNPTVIGDLVFAERPHETVANMPTIKLKGSITYRDEREELRNIKDDPAAVRDTVVAQFTETKGRSAAEMMATVLQLLHSSIPSLARRSPTVFFEQLTPKMFFDVMAAIAASAGPESKAEVMLEGRLYTFPFSLSTLKDLLLGTMNRVIQRLHSIDTQDLVSVFIMTLSQITYNRIQKHRTGKTKVMNHFLRDFLYLLNLHKSNKIGDQADYCALLQTAPTTDTELLVRCAAYRTLKLGSLQVASREELDRYRAYLDIFMSVMARVKGNTTWTNFLNAQVFATEANLYAETTGQYTYELLQRNISAQRRNTGEANLLTTLYADMHPAIGGQKKPMRTARDALVALRSYTQDLMKLPVAVRKTIPRILDSCLGRVRRFLGAKQFTWFMKIRPNVLHATSLFAAITAAEAAAYPQPDLIPNNFISYLDLTRFAQVQLELESLAIIVDSEKSMQDVVSSMRGVPVVTEESREEYRKLKRRLDAFSVRTIEAAAGWALRLLSETKGGLNIAIGLLALKSPTSVHLPKALELIIAGPQVLRFLRSAIDVAVVLENLSGAGQADLEQFRFGLSGYRAVAVSEAQTTALDLRRKCDLGQAITNIELALHPLTGGQNIHRTCTELLARSPELFAQGSLQSRGMTADAVFCYLYLDLTSRNGAEFLPYDAMGRTFIDGDQTVASFMKQVVNPGVKTQARTEAAQKATPYLRALLVACKGHTLGRVGAAQFASMDDRTGVVSYVISTEVEITTDDQNNPLTPVELFGRVARLSFGVDQIGAAGEKVAVASVHYPAALEDWYTFLNPDSLEETIDEVQAGTRVFDARVLANTSAANRFVDLTDFMFSLRQGSPIAPKDAITGAAHQLINNPILASPENYGLALLVTDLQSLAENAKIECFKTSMESIETYLPMTILDKHLQTYDCFVRQFQQGLAAAEAAKNNSVDSIATAIDAIEQEYANRADQLYHLVMEDPQKTGRAQAMGLDFFKQVPALGYEVVFTILSGIARQQPWGQVFGELQRLKTLRWALNSPTPDRRRIVNSVERPRFYNPMATAADLLAVIHSGRYERRRAPRMLLLKRTVALAKKFGKRLREDRHDRANRILAADQLNNAILQLQAPNAALDAPGAAAGLGAPLDAEQPQGGEGTEGENIEVARAPEELTGVEEGAKPEAEDETVGDKDLQNLGASDLSRTPSTVVSEDDLDEGGRLDKDE